MEHWMTWDPCDGWTEHATEAEARSSHALALDHACDQSADEGWPEDVDRCGVWRLVPVVTVELRQTATAADDTEDGERCRARGWDYIAEAVETEHPDEVAALRAEVDRLRGLLGFLPVETPAKRCSCGGGGFIGPTHEIPCPDCDCDAESWGGRAPVDWPSTAGGAP